VFNLTKTLVFNVAMLRTLAKELGPYLMLELLLPGGSLVALALFIYQRRSLRAALAPARMHGNTAPQSRSGL
jgi:hypothetical protein